MIVDSPRLLDSCCQCYLPSYLCPLFEWWSSLVSGSISDKHRCMEALNSKFSTTSGQRHEYCIPVFTKVTTTFCCHALNSQLNLQPLWERLKPTYRLYLPFLPIQAWGMNVKMTVFTWLLKFQRFTQSGPKSPDPSLRLPHIESDWYCRTERVWFVRLGYKAILLEWCGFYIFFELLF